MNIDSFFNFLLFIKIYMQLIDLPKSIIKIILDYHKDIYKLCWVENKHFIFSYKFNMSKKKKKKNIYRMTKISSKKFFDNWTWSHFIFGMILSKYKFYIMLIIKILWEIFEQTKIFHYIIAIIVKKIKVSLTLNEIINQYYNGDSLINSVGDIIWSILGYFLNKILKIPIKILWIIFWIMFVIFSIIDYFTYLE